MGLHRLRVWELDHKGLLPHQGGRWLPVQRHTPPAWAAQANKFTLGELQASTQTPTAPTPDEQALTAHALPKIRLTSKQSAAGTAFGGPAPPPVTDEEQIQKLQKIKPII